MVIQMRQIGFALVLFFALGQVIQVQLPVIPFNLEDIGIIACVILALTFGLNIRFSGLILAFAFIEFMVQALHPLVNGQFSRVIIAALKSGILFFAASIVREMFLRDEERAMNVLARAWVVAAGISAAIIWLQFVGLLPNLVIIQGELTFKSRPAGLQNDANFAAYSLVAALVLLRFLDWRPALKNTAFVLIFGALVFTESRMGLILLLACYAYLWFPKSNRVSRQKTLAATTAATVLFLAVGSFLAYSSFGSGTGIVAELRFVERFVEASRSLDAITLSTLERMRGYQEESTAERLMLALAGIKVWQANFWFGVGDNLVEEIANLVMVAKAPHNAFIDRLAIGGVAGVAFAVFVVHLIARSIVTPGGARRATRELAVSLLIIVTLGGIFLNLSFWLPVALLSVCFSIPRHAPPSRLHGAADPPGAAAIT